MVFLTPASIDLTLQQVVQTIRMLQFPMLFELMYTMYVGEYIGLVVLVTL